LRGLPGEAVVEGVHTEAGRAAQAAVKLYGGAMTAEDAAGGGFILTTRLPLPDRRP
jgi:hypothetical protein